MDNLEAIKASFYQAAFGDMSWESASNGLRHVLNSDLATLYTTNRTSGRDITLHGDCSEHYTGLYRQLSGINPFVPVLRTLRPGDIATEASLPDFDFIRSPFFGEWMRPQRLRSVAVINMFSLDGSASYAMFSRGGSPFRDEDIATLKALQPGLRQAMELNARLGRGRLEQTGQVLDSKAIGWLAVEVGGKIAWLNRTAESQLAMIGGTLTARHGMLRASDPKQTQKLFTALHAATASSEHARGSNIVFRSHDAETAIAASVVPAGHMLVKGLPEIHGAYVALQDLSPRLPSGLAARIAEMFELTPREAELAVALASGQTVAESALARGLSIPTVRTQLAQLLRKTGTGRQSQVVALLLSTVPFPFDS